jgi:hypothetical protein
MKGGRVCLADGWLGVKDDFRNWVRLGFQPEKRNENR